MTDKPDDTAIQPQDVRTPQRLRVFYEIMDKQAAEQGAQGKDEIEKNLLVAMIRAHGLLWASVQATYILEALEQKVMGMEADLTAAYARIAELEKHTINNIDIGR